MMMNKKHIKSSFLQIEMYTKIGPIERILGLFAICFIMFLAFKHHRLKSSVASTGLHHLTITEVSQSMESTNVSQFIVRTLGKPPS